MINMGIIGFGKMGSANLNGGKAYPLYKGREKRYDES